MFLFILLFLVIVFAQPDDSEVPGPSNPRPETPPPTVETPPLFGTFGTRFFKTLPRAPRTTSSTKTPPSPKKTPPPSPPSARGPLPPIPTGTIPRTPRSGTTLRRSKSLPRGGWGSRLFGSQSGPGVRHGETSPKRTGRQSPPTISWTGVQQHPVAPRQAEDPLLDIDTQNKFTELQTTEESFVLGLVELEEYMEKHPEIFKPKYITIVQFLINKHNNFLKKLILANTEKKVSLIITALEDFTLFMLEIEMKNTYVKFIGAINKWLKTLEKYNPFPRKNRELSIIGGLILLPMQRLPRYELLLLDLIKSPQLQGNVVVKRALDASKEMANYVNSKTKKMK
ncbi:hypothetical protein EIN_281790 [Entamoeba invadens IP1]|uniref:DH domain-containing protein n=1 Tax=Entamoeba invadens IP1 TaxID=370355 RepID=A0A0A1TX22_ENTIV|nr:hypothetical protein EIN_281790 [Entamoeba invadens IP1]ELP85808.1 hypothetical protein EIN_281790 [Entamoeba invadens IP1]|eukprot:XP_004185154.1 hypothetical protein EIN_281790 [Entamoeba invadens IP1]